MDIMIQYMTPLTVTAIRHTDYGDWTLMDPIDIRFDPKQFKLKVTESTPSVTLDEEHGTFHLPAGFVTSFASGPRALAATFPSYHPTYGFASVLHDWLYNRHDICSRKVADAVFCAAMKAGKTKRYRQVLMYQAVRWFGQPSWEIAPTKTAWHDTETPLEYAVDTEFEPLL